ncbi:transcription-associated protein 1, partial [Coemansia nantahalensis]
MRRIVSDICAACYDPDAGTKRSGCEGIAFAVQELDLGPTWLTDNLLELCKALLFTLKDAGSRTIQGTQPTSAGATLLDIVRRAFPESLFARGDEGSPAAVDKDGDVEMEPPADRMQENDPGSDIEELSAAAAPGVAGTDIGAGTAADDGLDAGADEDADANADADGDVPMAAANGIADADSGGPDIVALSSNASPAGPPDSVHSVAPIPDGAADTGDTAASGDEAEAPAGADAGPDSERPEHAAPPATPAAVRKARAAFQALVARLPPESAQLLRSFLALITKELANASAAVRTTVKECLDLLAAATGCSITALLLPSRDRLLVPIFGRPLRALPHSMQIGNIDAITYCLALDPPLLDINEELLRLLSEALALADAEDQALVNHPAQVHSSTESLTHLRHVCIRMLTAAMARPEFADAKNTPTRARIISVFFKSLYHKSVEVVDAANDGLRQVLLHQQKLPRDLLQTGLRPILINLSDYKRLTVASLDGLARLLQLLTNYFKVEVGRKLLDHMQ